MYTTVNNVFFITALHFKDAFVKNENKIFRGNIIDACDAYHIYTHYKKGHPGQTFNINRRSLVGSNYVDLQTRKEESMSRINGYEYKKLDTHNLGDVITLKVKGQVMVFCL